MNPTTNTPAAPEPRPEDFEGWDVEPGWGPLPTLDELQAEVAELRAELADARLALGRVQGGPPVEWDRWILQLSDKVFLECLGPKSGEDLKNLQARRGRGKGSDVGTRSWPRATRRVWAA